MSVVLTLLFLVMTFLVGWLLLTVIEVGKWMERVGLSFLLGSWLLTLQMMIAYQVLGSFSPAITFGCGALSCILLLFALGRQKWSKGVSQLKETIVSWSQFPSLLYSALQKMSWLEKTALVIVSSFLAITTLSNLTWPVSDWDAVALYDFRALVIKAVGHWQEGKALGYFYHYPPYTSLLHGALYQLGFERVKIVYSLLFSSFLLVFYSLLRRQFSRLTALVGMLIMTIAPLVWGHVTVAYTNLPYTIFFSLSMMYAWEWIEHHQVRSAMVSLLLVSASVWVRQSEPFWIVVLGLIALGFFLKKGDRPWKELGGLVIFFILTLQYWPWYVRSLDLPPPPAVFNDAEGYAVPITIGNLVWHTFLVTDHIFRHVFQPVSVLLYPFAAFIIFDQQATKSKIFRISCLSLLALLGMVFLGTFYFSFTYKTWNLIGESLTRMVMLTVPLLVYLLMHSSFWKNVFELFIRNGRKP